MIIESTQPAPVVATRILSCGHEPSPHESNVGTGVCGLPDGREVCYECGDAWQRAAMATEDHVTGYLTTDGRITTWSGGTLARVTSQVSRKVGFGHSTRIYLKAVDPTGKKWHGTSAGPGMYANLRASVRR